MEECKKGVTFWEKLMPVILCNSKAHNLPCWSYEWLYLIVTEVY